MPLKSFKMSRLVSSDRKPLKQVLSTTRPTRISVLSRSERLIAFESVGRRPIIGRSSADNRPTHRPMICGSFKYDIRIRIRIRIVYW